MSWLCKKEHGEALSSNSWFIRFRKSPAAEIRLFCFPYAGGSAAVFRTWEQEYPGAVEVFSALLVFELARRLRRKGGPAPVRLFASACNAPQIPDRSDPISTLPDDEFLSALKRLNGTPDDILENEELMALMLPTVRADFEVFETYRYSYEPAFDFPITVFGGLHDVRVSRMGLEGWSFQTNSDFTLNLLPGDHFFIHSCQAPLLGLIAKDLDKSQKV
jgi:medium-chain acyl-[acyl-carrier-protein] hydrolase